METSYSPVSVVPMSNVDLPLGSIGAPEDVTGTKVTKYVAILRAQTRSQKQTLFCDDDHETD